MKRIDSQHFIFWNADGKIIPHLLYEYFENEGIGIYFIDQKNKKNSNPVIVKIEGNIVMQVNYGYLLEKTKRHILNVTSETGNDAGPILDSLHARTALFNEKNLKLLKHLNLDFIEDSADSGFFFFRNCIVKVTEKDICLAPYSDYDNYVWDKSIIQKDFFPADSEELENSDFMKFLKDLTRVREKKISEKRFFSLCSAIGYLLHRYKNPATTKAIVLMDIYVNGMPNGGSGKTLLLSSIGKLRNLSIIDGKKYDQREWFALSSVDLTSDILLFDDLEKNFDFEQIFPIMTTGMYVRLKYRNHVWIPFEKAPKVALTTNYAINGDSESHKRRKFEFEVSPTFSASYTPCDKFGHNFFSDWNDQQWNMFYNVMFNCLQLFLKNRLITSEPINLSLNKLINSTSEEFIEWSETHLKEDVQLVKKLLYDNFLQSYPEFNNRLKQREFTFWLRAWGEYHKYTIIEGHSGDLRTIIFNTKNKNHENT
jgi:hypothetical protein